ncbi:hypothetical protein Taro_013426 [Colocasia esculenta]|uniref:Uncharacterized protein n=1 Tax=Colocasia esculenta TaxID=4460 RepID=A0A843UC06_COLES|nr:hypothetical protein [Colocasia esculenta]
MLPSPSLIEKATGHVSPSGWRQPRRRNPTDMIATRPLSLSGLTPEGDIGPVTSLLPDADTCHPSSDHYTTKMHVASSKERRRHRASRLPNWKATSHMSSSEGDKPCVATLDGGRLVRMLTPVIPLQTTSRQRCMRLAAKKESDIGLVAFPTGRRQATCRLQKAIYNVSPPLMEGDLSG